MSSTSAPVAAAVAAAVRAELARAGITGRQLSRDLGWSAAGVHRRMNGSTPFQLAELQTVADHLKIPITTFFEPAPSIAEPAEQAS